MKPAMKASPTLANALGMAEIPLKDLKKQYTDQDSRFTEVNGLEIHYRDVGEGPVIVLLHGVMSSLQTWDGWNEELRQNFRVISLDLPGFGLTGGPEDLDEYNEDYVFNTFAKFLDNIEVTRFSLAGNSFGGYIAARYAAQYPERVEKLILIDPSGYPQERPWIYKAATWPVVSTLAKFVQPPFLITQNVMEIYGDKTRLSKDNLYRYVHMAQRPGAKKVYIKTMQMQAEASKEERPLPFASIDAPTLLMWGELDHWTPIEMAERWKADVRRLEFISYPGVGHVPMEEIPYQSVQDAIVFLADVQQAPIQSSPSMDELESILQGDDLSSDFAPMEGL